MSRRTTLASVCAVLIVCVILAVAVGITRGQGATTSVKGFPFVQIGKTYQAGGYRFSVTQDLGNGWIEAETGEPYGKEFVNLNQMHSLWQVLSTR